MTVNVGHLHKKKIVKDTSGNIIDWLDEADGGWIIKNRQIINQKKYDEILKKQKEKQEAIKVAAEARSNPESFQKPQAPDRTINPSKLDGLEKRVGAMEDKLDKILQALDKNHD